MQLRVNYIIRTSQTDANDFLYAGEAESFTDGKITKKFNYSKAFVMMGKTSN